MSSNVLSYGYMAVLEKPIGSYKDAAEAWEVMQDKLYDDGTQLALNYEGTLLFSDISPSGPEEICELVVQHDNPVDFMRKAQEAGAAVDPATVRWYSCVWYNGTDSNMSDMSLDDFKKKIGSQS